MPNRTDPPTPQSAGFLSRLRGILGMAGGRQEPRQGLGGASFSGGGSRGMSGESPHPSSSKPSVPRHAPEALDGQRNPPSWNAGKDEREIVALVDRLFKESGEARRIHEGRFLTNWAYYQNDQYSYWDANTGSMKQYKDIDTNPYRTWAVDNKIRPKLRKLIARTMESHLETTVSAFSQTEDDIAHAEAARGILEHIASETNQDMQDMELTRGTTIIGPMFRKTWVDPTKTILRPINAQGGEFEDYVEESSGGINRAVFGWEEAYPDPRSADPERWQWFIHAQELTLEEVQALSPDRWQYVGMSGTGGEGGFENAQARIDVTNHDYQRSKARKQMVLVKELWLLPQSGGDWPDGLVAWVCNGVLLWSGPWLYPSLTTLPFTQYVYERSYGTPWAHSALDSARGPQDIYNDMLSSMVDRAKEGPKLIISTGMGLTSQSFRRGRPYEVIPVNDYVDGKIQYLNPPPIEASVIQALRTAENDIAEALEVNPVSDGAAPAGVTAAAAIQSLEGFNRSGSRIAIEFYRLALRRDMEISLQIAKDVYSGEAVLARRESSINVQGTQDDTDIARVSELLGALGATSDDWAQALSHAPADKKATRSHVIDLNALQRGRATVDVMATAPKTPAQRQQDLMQMVSAGMFAAENLETTIPVLELMQVEDFDGVRARLLRMLMSRQAKAQGDVEAAQEAQQAQMQAAQESEMQARQAQQQTAEQAQAEALRVEQARSEQEAQKILLDAQIRRESEAAKRESEAAKNQVELEKARINAETQIQVALIRAGSQQAGAMGGIGDEANIGDEDDGVGNGYEQGIGAVIDPEYRVGDPEYPEGVAEYPGEGIGQEALQDTQESEM